MPNVLRIYKHGHKPRPELLKQSFHDYQSMPSAFLKVNKKQTIKKKKAQLLDLHRWVWFRAVKSLPLSRSLVRRPGDVVFGEELIVYQCAVDALPRVMSLSVVVWIFWFVCFFFAYLPIFFFRLLFWAWPPMREPACWSRASTWNRHCPLGGPRTSKWNLFLLPGLWKVLASPSPPVALLPWLSDGVEHLLSWKPQWQQMSGKVMSPKVVRIWDLVSWTEHKQ